MNSAGNQAMTPAGVDAAQPAAAMTRAAVPLPATVVVAPLETLLWRVRRLGPARVGGVALLLAALLALALVVWPQRQQADLLRDQLISMPAAATSAAKPMVDATARFVAALPTRAQLPDVMDKVLATAGEAGVVLDRGSYDFVLAKGAAIGRYEMSLPVTGSYRSIRSFIEGTLASNPAIALDAMQLQREDVQTDALLVELKFVVFTRDAP